MPLKMTLERLLPSALADGSADLSDTNVSSLLPGSLEPSLLATARRLVARRNRLHSMEGVAHFTKLEFLDVSENSFRALDARSATDLAYCRQLHTVLASANNISFVDLGSIVHGLPHTPWASLTALDLSSNILSELPSVACCSSLTLLNLDNNSISSLDGVERCLPTRLASLSVRSNTIADWYELLHLLPLTECLQTLHVESNPCMERAVQDGVDCAVLASALCINIIEFNGVELSDEQRTLSGRILDSVAGQPTSRNDILATMRQHCPLTTRRAEPVGVDQYADTLDELSGRVQKVFKVVNVLRAADKCRRQLAAVKIQSIMRMFLVRRRLFTQYKRQLPHWRSHFPTKAEAIWQSRAAIRSLTTRVDALEASLRQVWVDQSHFRGFLHSKRVFAAMTIQKYWKGCVARRRYRAIRNEYLQFARGFLPAIVRIQSFARMIIAKRRARGLRRQHSREKRLEAQVKTLQHEVQELRSIVFRLIGESQAGLRGPQAQERAQHLFTPISTAETPTAEAPPAVPLGSVRAVNHRASGPPQSTVTSAARRTESQVLPSSASPSPNEGTSPEARNPSTIKPVAADPSAAVSNGGKRGGRRVPPPVPIHDVPQHLRPGSDRTGNVAPKNLPTQVTRAASFQSSISSPNDSREAITRSAASARVDHAHFYVGGSAIDDDAEHDEVRYDDAHVDFGSEARHSSTEYSIDFGGVVQEGDARYTERISTIPAQ